MAAKMVMITTPAKKMAPGPASAGTHPGIYAEHVLGKLPEQVVAKVLHDTAAELYGLA